MTKNSHRFQVSKWLDIYKRFQAASYSQIVAFLNKNQSYFFFFIFEHYSVKINFLSFFSSSGTQNFQHLFGCHTIGIISSFNISLSSLWFSNSIYQAKNLIIFYDSQKKLSWLEKNLKQYAWQRSCSD